MTATASQPAAASALRVLTSDQVAQYHEQGYLIFPSLFSAEETRRMLEECDAIHRGEYGELFAGSAQVEPEFAEAVKKNPDLAKLARKFSAVVERSVVFRRTMLESRLIDIMRDILGPDLLLFRDILMMKPAKVGSKMPWHQDSNYWPVRPADLCSAWTALDEATVENGCMRVVPGSHKLDLIPSRIKGSYALEDDQVDLSKAIDVPLKPGSSLVFHSRLLHGSEPNRSDRSRRAFITSFMSARTTQIRPDGRTRYFRVSGRTYPDCVRSSDGL